MSLNIPSFLSLESSRIISKLAKAYGFDLSNFKQNIYLSLELEGYDRLVLERNERHVISLSHYYVQNGDLMSNPDVVFFVRPAQNGSDLVIYPTAITQSPLGYYQEVAELDPTCSKLETFKSKAMGDLAAFCNTWATNIQNQNWFLDDGQPNPDITCKTS